MRNAINGALLLLMLLPRFASAQTGGALFPISDGGMWGYIDSTGRIVIPPRYDDAGTFHDGLARVTEHGRPIFIDTAGGVMIRPSFDVVGEFSEGLAPVNIGEKRYASLGLLRKPGRWGYIDRTGKLVMPLKFSKADPFSEGLAAVHDGKRSGFIDRTGRMVFEAPFDVSWGFHEGIVLVKSSLKMIYLDRSGKRIPTPQLDDNYYGRDFSEGLAAVKIGDVWGYIDTRGKLVIAPQFIEAWNFSGGRAAAEVPIDRTVEKPCAMPGETASSYTVGKRYGYIDTRGIMVIPPLFESAGEFAEGRASVSNCYVSSFIDTTGAPAIRRQFEEAAPFSHGLALVAITEGEARYSAYIDRTGRILWKRPR